MAVRWYSRCTSGCIFFFTPFFKTVPEAACLKDSRKKAKDWCLEDVLQAESLLLVFV